MRRLDKNGQKYRVDISPDAWVRIGMLPTSVFRRIQDELTRIAEVETARDSGSDLAEALDATLAFSIDHHTVYYLIESRTRSVTLLDVRPSKR